MTGTDAHALEASGAPLDTVARLPLQALDFAVEIADALLTAKTAHEVYHLALTRLAPAFGARFACVYLRDPHDERLLKLEAAYGFPQRPARHLAEMRIREGSGPTGRAVADRTPIEVVNVFDDPALEEWWEPARELGFVSIISMPLLRPSASHDEDPVQDAVGAMSLYFAKPQAISNRASQLLHLVADQLAAAADRTQLLTDLHAANDLLHDQNRLLQQKYQEAEAEKRFKDEFLANISHEVRTPLTSVLGYAYLLANGQLGPVNDRQRTALASIEGAGNGLLRIIGDLIDLANVRLGRLEANVGADDAVQIAARASDAVGAPPEGVEFEIDAQEPHLAILTDGEKATRILAALLSNAFKFTERGSVVLRVRRLDLDGREHVEWSVQDTGIGVTPDQLSIIFRDFSQADGSATRRHGGIGVGLALCLGFANLLGGSLAAQSTPDEGSTFRLQLPVQPRVD